MENISATEAKQRMGALLDAVQHGPVVIQKQNRDVAVIISPEDYMRLKGLGLQEFDRFCDRIGQQAALRGLDEERLSELLEK